MTSPHLPLNALRAFEASARHLSFTCAARELHVTQAAVSQQVRALEVQLGAQLFRRLPRGLALTDEGLALLPVLSDAFDRIKSIIKRFDSGHVTEVLTVSAVGTFAVGWLMSRLQSFREAHPFVELRLLTHNNVVDLAGEGLDFAIRFGDGVWPGIQAAQLLDAPLSVLCTPTMARRLKTPGDLAREILLRSYRSDDWPCWFAAAGIEPPAIRGPIFDSSRLMAEAAMQGAGAALVPVSMFAQELCEGRLVQPFPVASNVGGYWLTWLRSKRMTTAMHGFKNWITEQAAQVAT
ncbi:LysR family transcriptional regulator [Dongia soli]|uniref:LysR family transcriptional regulator n=1 Tax=Dongia soli TaxID=600628 RepID=A0ABU5EAM2_9PROT|nr:LysR family transcriptional regulator [Dongia soli]MDY0883405.1 LysR family transcriptional regulator [Dongia soli]